MVTMRLLQLSLLMGFPLFAKIDPADWSKAKTSNEAEALFVRRLADFWQEGEYGIVKSQVEDFLASFPESQFAEPVRVCYGDLLLREKNYSGALAAYAALTSPDFRDKVFLNRMQCLYSLEWYSTLADECEEYLKNSLDEETSLKTTFYLAIALYRQCLNASKDPEILLKLAKRAEPYFETLLESSLSSEVSQAFAHLCCILKDYQKAADIYLDLAMKDPLAEDEMNFQAALIQAAYDKDLALQSFERIEKNGKEKAKEAAYNRLVLSFGAGHHEDIAKSKETILSSIPEDREAMARFFIGRSLLSLKKYSEASEELMAFLNIAPPSASPESIRSGWLSLIEAAHQSCDVATLDTALLKLSEIDPFDGQIPKGRLLRALLLKNSGRIEEARVDLKNLLAAYSDFSDSAAALFEWADLEYQAGCWDACRSRSFAFLEQFPSHDLAPFAWRYLATASSHLSNENTRAMERFAKDLRALLQQKDLFSASETSDWTFYLARACFHLGRLKQAIGFLESILEESTPFPQEANAHLLLGLCYRDELGDFAAFCKKAETAIEMKADLVEDGQLHVSLFNAYLALSNEIPALIEKSVEHLYEAFLANADISKENLLWLGDWYFFKQNEPALKIFSALADLGFDETVFYKLGQLYSWMGRTEDQIVLLERSMEAYLDPAAEWKWERETKLLLAEAYIGKGLEDKALGLLNEVTNGNTATQSETIAKAYLERARIFSERLKKNPNEQGLSEVASQFKDLILQRRLEQEPIHLEAALEYVDLLEKTAPNPLEKRLALLEKVKNDFENADDLLSKDYHQARLKYPAKNRIFEDYMRFLDFETLMAKSELSNDTGLQKELQAKAKHLLLQINSECGQPALLKRVSSRLKNADVSFPK
jgi:hypothetical protein